jgi:hypothetical protein
MFAVTQALVFHFFYVLPSPCCAFGNWTHTQNYYFLKVHKGWISLLYDHLQIGFYYFDFSPPFSFRKKRENHWREAAHTVGDDLFSLSTFLYIFLIGRADGRGSRLSSGLSRMKKINKKWRGISFSPSAVYISLSGRIILGRIGPPRGIYEWPRVH